MPTPFFADLVREIAQEGGTGPLMPTGAVPGHRRFADAVPADTGFYYVTKKNPRNHTEKFTFKKYDPIARKHVEFKEAKIK